MQMKASAMAYSSQLLVPFHGYLDEERHILPVDMLFCSLSNLYSTTTIEFFEQHSRKSIVVNGYPLAGSKQQRVLEFISVLSKQYNLPSGFHLESKNSFPSRSGLGSSGSAFASITRAIGSMVGEEDERTLSKLARLGSISAACSLVGGVSILHGRTKRLWADQIIEPANVPIGALAVAVHATRDAIDRHREARRSPLYDTVLQISKGASSEMCEALKAKDFFQIAEIAERQLSYTIAVLSTGPSHLVIWHPKTVAVLEAVRSFRAHTGIPAFCAMNSGPSLFAYAPIEQLNNLAKVLEDLDVDFIRCTPVGGARITKEHLF